MISSAGAYGSSDAVVITGAHRSGTTLLGDIVAQADGTWTVWEPFNRHWGLRDVRIAYPYLRRTDPLAAPISTLNRYLESGRGRWSAKRDAGGPKVPQLHAAVKTFKRRAAWHRNSARTPVIKDPFLLLALDAIQPAITLRPIVVSVRHPCAWLLSLRRMSWPAGPELNDLIAQHELYEEHLSHLLPRRDWTAADDVEAGATAWLCLYHMVHVQVAAGAQATVVPIESFARDPVATIRLLFQVTSLPAPSDLTSLAATYTGAGNAVTPEAGIRHLLQRNSQLLVDAWKAGMSRDEINRVRGITEPVFDALYADWDTAEGHPIDIHADR